MEHLFYFAFLDLESLKFSENFKGNFARQILWTFFFKYTILSVFHFFLVVKKKFVRSNFFFKLGGEVCNGWDKFVLPDSTGTIRRQSGKWNLCLLFDHAFMAGQLTRDLSMFVNSKLCIPFSLCLV